MYQYGVSGMISRTKYHPLRSHWPIFFARIVLSVFSMRQKSIGKWLTRSGHVWSHKSNLLKSRIPVIRTRMPITGSNEKVRVIKFWIRVINLNYGLHQQITGC